MLERLVSDVGPELRDSPVADSAGTIPGRRTEPRIRITDPRFKYVDSANTCIAKTFARLRAEAERAEVARRAKLTPLRKVQS